MYFTRKPQLILCKCRSDAVQEATLDLHSSSTIPSPIERRRSQEAGSKGTSLINHHCTGKKQCTVSREKKKTTKQSGACGAIKPRAQEILLDVVQLSALIQVFKNQNVQEESVEIFLGTSRGRVDDLLWSGPDVHMEHSHSAKFFVKKKKKKVWVCWKKRAFKKTPIPDQNVEPRPFLEAALTQTRH